MDNSGAGASQGVPTAEDFAVLRARIDHLEAAFEGLQDAVYREAERYERELADLRRDIQPEEMARALSVDARRRGL
jgi:hypothetical protein